MQMALPRRQCLSLKVECLKALEPLGDIPDTTGNPPSALKSPQSVLHYTTLHYTTLHYTTLQSILYFTAHTTLHYTTDCTIQHYTQLCWVAIQRPGLSLEHQKITWIYDYEILLSVFRFFCILNYPGCVYLVMNIFCIKYFVETINTFDLL